MSSQEYGPNAAPFDEGDLFTGALAALANFRDAQLRHSEELRGNGTLLKAVLALEKIPDSGITDEVLASSPWWACIHTERDTDQQVTGGGICLNLPGVNMERQRVETARVRLMAFTILGTEVDMCAVTPISPFTDDEAARLFGMYQELVSIIREGERTGLRARPDLTDMAVPAGLSRRPRLA